MIQMRFNISLPGVREEVKGRVLARQTKIALELLRGIVNMTPVDTGRAKGNWYVTLGTPATGFDWEKHDIAGGETINDGYQTIQGLQDYGAIYLTNNLPYIIALEKGHSKQAPAGMVQVSLDRVSAGLR
jgi:hypothetical protein